ncbi:uncharacterized protein LOC120339138 [Styela clava]
MSTFDDWLSWFVHVNDPSVLEMWKDQPTYIFVNLIVITMASLSLMFALRHGLDSRYTYFWLATLLHGIVTELVSYNLPDINNFWHSQTFMMFAGRRFPLYIVLFYPATVTHAYIAASRLKLPWWAEPFAVGLFDVLIDFPYDIMGIKMVWWTWHDTDPNLFDRHYWVPWTSYFFHMSFHSSLVFLLHGTRYVITGNTSKDKSSGFFKEMLCVIITSSFSMGFAIIFQLLPIYHGLKDGFGLHTENIMFVVFGLYFAIVWYADRTPTNDARAQNKISKTYWWNNETGIAILLHYIFYIILVVIAKPQYVKSHGMHETLGPRSETMKMPVVSGAVYIKQRYFDPASYDEGYIDFHCLPEGAPNLTANPHDVGKSWYTVCGNKFENHVEYIVMIWSFCFLGIFAFYNALGRSATQENVDETILKKEEMQKSQRNRRQDVTKKTGKNKKKSQ